MLGLGAIQLSTFYKYSLSFCHARRREFSLRRKERMKILLSWNKDSDEVRHQHVSYSAVWGHSGVWLCPVNLGARADRVFIVLSPEKPGMTPENWHCSESESPESGALVSGLITHIPCVSMTLEKLFPLCTSWDLPHVPAMCDAHEMVLRMPPLIFLSFQRPRISGQVHGSQWLLCLRGEPQGDTLSPDNSDSQQESDPQNILSTYRCKVL